MRRIVGRLGLIVPPLAVLGADAVIRRSMYAELLRRGAVPFVTTWLLSALLWVLLLVAATRRRGAARWLARAGLAVLAALAGFQLCAFSNFDTFVTYDVLRGAFLLHGFGALVAPFAGTIARWTLLPASVVVAYAIGVTRVAPAARLHARRAAAGAIALGAVATASVAYVAVVPLGAAPDVLALGTLGRFAIEHPTKLHIAGTTWRKIPSFRRTPPRLAPVARSERARNVLLVLTESVRADAICSAHADDCPHNPFSNAAAPDRLALQRMRSVDSFTSLSVGVIFTGLPVNAPKERWLDAPLVFDYAHAAGVTTAYWSAQHPAFADAHAWTDGAAIDHCAWATDFDPSADQVLGADDGVVVDHAIAALPTLPEPFFAVVHFSNTHFPYRIDDGDAPFQPESSKIDRHDIAPLRNRYYDAILRQDRATAKLVSAVHASPAGARTVIIFVSDHGESFYEHDTVLHGSSLWDQELRVPAWVDAPRGAFTDSELASLRGLRDVDVTQEDLAPTILDLLGILHTPEWSRYMQRMAGKSLLRAPAPNRTVVISTCNDLWPCFVPSWGKLIGDHKWIVRPPDEKFRCFDTHADPAEARDLGSSACGEIENR